MQIQRFRNTVRYGSTESGGLFGSKNKIAAVMAGQVDIGVDRSWVCAQHHRLAHRREQFMCPSKAIAVSELAVFTWLDTRPAITPVATRRAVAKLRYFIAIFAPCTNVRIH